MIPWFLTMNNIWFVWMIHQLLCLLSSLTHFCSSKGDASFSPSLLSCLAPFSFLPNLKKDITLLFLRTVFSLPAPFYRYARVIHTISLISPPSDHFITTGYKQPFRYLFLDRFNAVFHSFVHVVSFPNNPRWSAGWAAQGPNRSIAMCKCLMLLLAIICPVRFYLLQTITSSLFENYCLVFEDLAS